MNKRIGWIDIAKGITILLVIVGHTLIGYKVNDYIYAFHMPLFFICSGLLFKPKDIKMVAKNNAKKLLVPYYVTCGIVIAARAISAYLQNWTPEQIKYLTVNTSIAALFAYGVDGCKWFFNVWMIGAVWFFWAFFWSNLFLQIIFYVTRDKEEWQRACLVIIVATLSFIVGQYIWIPTNVDIGGFAVLFIYIGYLMRKVRVWEKGKLPWYAYIAFVIIWVEASKIGGINMVIRLVPGWIIIPGAVAGTLLIFKGSCIAEKIKPVSDVFSWYGRNTLKILCAHYFELVIIPWDKLLLGMGIENRRLFVITCRVVFATVAVLLINGLMVLVKKLKQKNKSETDVSGQVV